MPQFGSHAELVRALKKSGDALLASLTPWRCDLWHMLTGAVTEVGELATAVKAHVVYGKELDVENVIEELGDLEFYLEGIRQTLGIERLTVLNANMAKLEKRYGATYSNQAALDRVDKTELVPVALAFVDEPPNMSAGESMAYHDALDIEVTELIAEADRLRGVVCIHNVPLSVPCLKCGDAHRELHVPVQPPRTNREIDLETTKRMMTQMREIQDRAKPGPMLWPESEHGAHE